MTAVKAMNNKGNMINICILAICLFSGTVCESGSSFMNLL